MEVLSNAYRCVRIPYSGGNPGRIRAATDFHRMFRPYVAGRDGLFLSNTWGDGNRDACINEDFIMQLDARVEYSFALSDYIPSGCGDAVVIGGHGEATLKDGVLHVMVSEKLGFIWVKILAGP